MQKATTLIADKLIAVIATASVLKQVSDTLEELTQDTSFKDHAHAIVTDPNLTLPQKRTQLLYLFRSLDTTPLYQFFTDFINQETLWLFDHSKIDYFDKFVAAFQTRTQMVKILDLVTAIELTDAEKTKIASDFSKFFGAKVIVNHEINTAIIGGVQAKVDNLVYDYSLRFKLLSFERQWLQTLKKTRALVGEPSAKKVTLLP